MALSGFVLTAAVSTLVSGVAAAAPATPRSGVPAGALEAVVLDGVSGPTLVAEPLPPRVRATHRPGPSSVTSVRAGTVARPTARATRSRPAAPPAPRAPRTVRPHGTSLQQAVARIPGYASHRPARWVVSSRYGSWGTTDWYHNTVYISPRVPASKLDSVVRHEWAHILQVRAYGSVDAAVAGTDRTFGGGGLTGAERAADCMALQLGATWTNYTACGRPDWRRAAAALLAGRRP